SGCQYITVLSVRAQASLQKSAQLTDHGRPASFTHVVEEGRTSAFRQSKPYASHRPTLDLGVDATGHPFVYGLHNTEAAQAIRGLFTWLRRLVPEQPSPGCVMGCR
ncbi:MAG TPA: hypothetical protein VGA96_15230, partial [Fibrella sp.]